MPLLLFFNASERLLSRKSKISRLKFSCVVGAVKGIYERFVFSMFSAAFTFLGPIGIDTTEKKRKAAAYSGSLAFISSMLLKSSESLCIAFLCVN